MRDGTTSNGGDLDVELENVSLAQGSSSLRYSILQSSPFGSQHHLEVALAITNLEESHQMQNEENWVENGPNQHPPRRRDHTVNMKEGNHPRNRYFLSIVAQHSQGNCNRKRENAIKRNKRVTMSLNV